ncbi:MAG: type III-A CRISPR-associated CARF protein Csm6 [Anaerobutyricum sp.]
MKSALLVMATLSEYRFLPIQVSTPQKKSNLEHEERDEYDVDANWELNMDNEETAENRCQEVKCLNLMRLLKIDMIKKHLLAYDYHAALAVGKEIKEDLSPVAYQWLETADARSLLDWTRMNRVLPENNGIITAVRGENEKKVLFEYMLALDLKVKRGEYADFIRAITPLGVDLLEIVLEQSCDIDITRYYKRNNQRIWDKNRLVGEILDILNQKFYPFRYGPVYSAHLLEIIQKKCTDTLMVQRIQELVNIEQNVRNVAAHNIVSVTPEWIKERTGKSVDDIFWILKYVCEQVKINTRKENWNSYDSMNKRIIDELDKD